MATKMIARTELASTGGDVRPSLLELERQRLLRERDEARAQARALAQTNRRMEEFLGIASHELRSPATSTRLCIQLAAARLDLLLDEGAPQGAALASQLAGLQDLLAKAESSLERLTRLVSDLLDVSRRQSGQLAVHPTRADLRALVRVAVDEQRQLAPTRRIRLHLATRKAVLVWTDADRFHQVVTNYLTNALTYAPPDRPVDVRVQVHEGWARVSVHDLGAGLPAEEQEHIWEPFHRASAGEVVGEPPPASAQNLGLGLYICKLIIEQHGGQVGVRSAPGQGSTFWFTLPVVRSGGDEQPRVAQDSA